MGSIGVIMIICLIVARVLRITTAVRPQPAAQLEPPAPKPRRAETLASVTEGELVLLTGTVRAASEPLRAISGTPCIAYLVVAEVMTEKKQLVTDLRETKSCPFWLDVADGAVFIEHEAVVTIRTTKLKSTDAEAARAMLAAHHLERYAESTTFAEGVIPVGARVEVAGVLVHGQADEQGYRDAQVRKQLVAHPRLRLSVRPVR